MTRDVVLLTTSEVAALFRVDESTIRRWAQDGTLRSVGLGRDLRFRRDEVEAALRGEMREAGAA